MHLVAATRSSDADWRPGTCHRHQGEARRSDTASAKVSCHRLAASAAIVATTRLIISPRWPSRDARASYSGIVRRQDRSAGAPIRCPPRSPRRWRTGKLSKISGKPGCAGEAMSFTGEHVGEGLARSRADNGGRCQDALHESLQPDLRQARTLRSVKQEPSDDKALLEHIGRSRPAGGHLLRMIDHDIAAGDKATRYAAINPSRQVVARIVRDAGRDHLLPVRQRDPGLDAMQAITLRACVFEPVARWSATAPRQAGNRRVA